jgi:hypothetical protein
MKAPARTLRFTTLALGLAVASALPAQTIDFLTTNGGFTTQNIVGNNPWTWTAGQGWRANGSTTVARSRLLSPILTASGGAFSISATHRYNFEDALTLTPPVCFDGGVVFASINGGAFAALAPTSGKGYDGVLSSTFSNPLAGQQAFCGNRSAADQISIWAGTLAAGTTIQLALDGAWDSSVSNLNPNWNIRSVSLSGFGAAPNVVPEPGTYVLMATGLAGLAAIRRRRATKA